MKRNTLSLQIDLDSKQEELDMVIAENISLAVALDKAIQGNSELEKSNKEITKLYEVMVNISNTKIKQRDFQERESANFERLYKAQVEISNQDSDLISRLKSTNETYKWITRGLIFAILILNLIIIFK